MLRILDRYIIRETLAPFAMALLVSTFLLELPPIIQQGEHLIAKGTSWAIVTRVLLTLLPQALGITIPMALLIGLLIALGRLSADRESVALQACGVSLFRLLRPLVVLMTGAAAATFYIMIEALPAANQAFRELTFRVVHTRVESEIKPRVFFADFPGWVLYVRETGPAGWRDVFVADTSQIEHPLVYIARRGRMMIDRDKRTVQMVLEEGASHRANAREPERYELTRFQQVVLSLNPDTVFPREGLTKGDQEMTIAELRALMTELEKAGGSTHNQVMAIQQKFSIPVACFVFGLIALPLGVTSRRDGKLASFVLGTGVIFAYYIVMYMGRSLAKGHLIPAWIAMWLPNLALGVPAIWLLVRRTRGTGRPPSFRIPMPIRRRRGPVAPPAETRPARAAAGSRVVVVIRVPQIHVPRPNILDWYVTRQCARVVGIAAVGLLGLFYISSFIDLSDKLFKGTATGTMIVSFLWFSTPQFVYYVTPMAVLIGGLVTIGSLTKNSELVVMKACGISLYRVAAPLLLVALVSSAVLFVLEERVLAYSNQRAETLNDVIRGRSPRTFDSLNQKWIVARSGAIYHYVYFDPRRNELNGLSVYELDRAQRLIGRSYWKHATYTGGGGNGEAAQWRGIEGWRRELGGKLTFTRIPQRALTLETPDYFKTERPDADRMSYTQLRGYIADLRVSGFDVVPYVVALQRKLAFPLVTVIMTLIAVPFAVTTGRRGAMYGVGAGIVLAIVYWTTISVFAAIGSGGLIQPVLAAWAPNLLFGAAAVYLLLTVRT